MANNASLTVSTDGASFANAGLCGCAVGCAPCCAAGRRRCNISRLLILAVVHPQDACQSWPWWSKQQGRLNTRVKFEAAAHEGLVRSTNLAAGKGNHYYFESDRSVETAACRVELGYCGALEGRQEPLVCKRFLILNQGRGRGSTDERRDGRLTGTFARVEDRLDSIAPLNPMLLNRLLKRRLSDAPASWRPSC